MTAMADSTPQAAVEGLRVSGLNTRLRGRPILEALSLPQLSPGSLVGLLGPNGSGKSTLLKSLAGLVPSSCAGLSLAGRDLRALNASDRAEYIRYLPQTLPGDIHLTVIGSMQVALRARRPLDRRDELPAIVNALEELGIAHLANRYLDELSGGQKQLVGLAQAVCREPDVLLLDEPLASLDLNHQHHVMQMLGQLTRERKLLTLIVLHDLNNVLRYCDQALLMRGGKLVGSGAPDAVITEQSLAATFSIRARLETSSQGLPYVLVDGRLPD
ncbi:MAG TPA: ABC transporter ATP-binding protein [Eoetvoesiella sp.]|jgi:iron complex transport system ATP-binding protein|uniref:ABC transporter ATP-binding protein n=1 Tax=Eoetvoesiella sp. TaxID=1966355 RepID=UPI002D0B73BB|nr:ABC transporter ATP-binding protein [Eoetvoesiella sp.]HWK60036.1 ABC transporter ATP-binding protein [Eoetvoesiella sp.]